MIVWLQSSSKSTIKQNSDKYEAEAKQNQTSTNGSNTSWTNQGVSVFLQTCVFCDVTQYSDL